ncbi:MAG: glutaredoxin family protein [Nanoarchaeota archaeon]|nr:glutaredoxin family protein [Nanoarchaeota archaeon]MBU1644521.1 glutaredoxin family protein [Nanoarchaeota archaeon]MBU1976414.1 glutaredoxin family protein [Nanoarchaeota archaeon]
MQIKLYTTPACPWCKLARTWLKRRRVDFEECDVSESQNGICRDEVLEKTGQLAVPILDINGEAIIGFNETKYEEAVKKFKLTPAKETETEESA